MISSGHLSIILGKY